MQKFLLYFISVDIWRMARQPFCSEFHGEQFIENLEAWKSRESDENCFLRCASKFSLIPVEIDRIGLFFGDFRSKLEYDISQVESESNLEMSG